jgi:hypothetical protein
MQTLSADPFSVAMAVADEDVVREALGHRFLSR